MQRLPYLQNVSEDLTQEDFNKLGDEIKAGLGNIIKDHYFSVSRTALGAGIYIRYRNGKDKTEWDNGIGDNDPGSMNFMIGDNDGKLIFEQAYRTFQLKNLADTKISKKSGTYDQIKKYAIEKICY